MPIPYEVLVRYGSDGQIKGAHVKYQSPVDFGRGVEWHEGPPMPLDHAGPEFAALVTEAMRQASATAEALRAELAAAKARLVALGQVV